MRTLAKSILTLVLLTTPVWAGTIPAPTLQPGRFVYTVPSGWMPPGFSQAGLDEMNHTAAGLKYPFYVVLVHDLPGALGRNQDEDATRAIDGLADDLSQQAGYDVGKSSIFMLSFTPRKWRFLAGATWKQQLNFVRDAHKPYTDNFVRAVQGTPKDPKGGIIATMRAIDEYLWDQTDPAKIAARQEAVRQAAVRRQLVAAETAIDGEISRLEQLLADPEYLPPDVSEYRTVLGQARAVRKADEYYQMTVFVSTVQQATNRLAPIVNQNKDEAQARSTTKAIEWMTLFVGGVILFAIFNTQRRRHRNLKQAFDVEADHWDQKVTNASNQYTSVYTDRDDVIGMDKAEGETKELYKKVTDEVNDIFLCIKGLESHISACRRVAASASFFNLGPLRQATAMFHTEFEFDTEKVNKDDLFGSETKIVRVVPQQFADEQAERFKKCQKEWQYLKTAAKTRMEPAELLLPIQHLHMTMRTAKEAGVPERWLSDHPLIDADKVYTELNALRYKNPVAVAKKADEYLAKITAVAERIDRLAKCLTEMTKSKSVLSKEDVTFLSSTVFDKADDPVSTLSAAQAAEFQVSGMLASADIDLKSLQKIEQAAKEVHDTYVKAGQQVGALKSATIHASEAIKAAEGSFALAEKTIDSTTTIVKRAALVHAEKGLKSALTHKEVARSHSAAGAASLVEAKKSLKLNRHLEALRLVDIARSHFDAATASSEKATSVCTSLDSKKTDYEKRAAAMEKTRQSRQQQLREYGRTNVTLNVWNAPRIDRSVDYDILLLEQLNYERQWQEHVNEAQRVAEREAEQARATIRAQEEAAAEARRSHHSSSSSGSSWDSSSSSSGGDWGGGGSDSGSSGGDW